MFARIAFAISAFSLVLTSPVLADEENAAETILVTASRVPVEAAQSGSAVSLIDGAALEAKQIPIVFDALREVPGVAVSRSGGLGSLSQIRIRGAEANHALVLIDGVEANDPASLDEFNFAHLLSAGIERIEILRGPQSALWGADALAGVVNVITLAPREGIYAKAGAEAGSFATRQVSGILNAGDESYGAVIDGGYLKSDGINIARTGREKDGYENASLDGRGFVELAPELVLSLNLRHVNSESEFDSGFPLPVDSADFTEAEQTYGRMQAKATLLHGALELIAGAARTHTVSDNFASTSFDFHNIERVSRVEAGKSKFDLQGNYFWTGSGLGFALDQRLSVLAESERKTFVQEVPGFSDADQDQNETSQAIAAEYGLALGDAAFLSLGLRHDWNERFADNTTWRATLSVPVLEWDARLHASAGTGVKNPDFFELFGFVPSTFVGNPDLGPEKSLGFDAGVEKHFGGMLKLDVTYYSADLRDEIFTDFSVFPFTARNASGTNKRDGVEVAASADLGNGLTLNAAYTYANSTADGAQELRRPRHIASFDAGYRFDEGRAFLNLSVALHGSQKDTDFTTFRSVTLDSYTLVRLAGAYEIHPGVKLTARIENAFNEHYEEVFGYRTQGFAAYAGLSVAFGE